MSALPDTDGPCHCGKRTVFARTQSTLEYRGHRVGPSIWHERHACGLLEEVRAAAGEEPLPGTPQWRAARGGGSEQTAAKVVAAVVEAGPTPPPPPVAPPAVDAIAMAAARVVCMCLFPTRLASRCVTCGGALP